MKTKILVFSLLIVFFILFFLDKTFAGWNDCNPPCKSGEVCMWWGARPVCMAGAQCSSNSDCAIGYVCYNNRCTNEDAPGVRTTTTTLSTTTSSQDNAQYNLDAWSSGCIDGEVPLAWRNIPIEEVRRRHGDAMVNNFKRMACSGINPTAIRELDLWTGNIPYEYRTPGGPSGNRNIWVYDLGTCTATWTGPNPQPYSSEEAARMIINGLLRDGFDCRGRRINEDDAGNFNLSRSSQFFTTNLPRDSQGNYLAYVGEEITYSWSIPNAGTITSFYIADAPDNCPGGIIRQGEEKPWVANSASGSIKAVAQQCQLGRTYTITIKNNNQPVASIKIKIVDRSVISGTTIPTSSFNPLDTSYYRGPVTLSFENQNRQPTSTQYQQSTSTINTNFQIQILTILSAILQRLTEVLGSVSRLPNEIQNQVIGQLTDSIQLINYILKNVLSNDNISNDNINNTTNITSTSTPTSSLSIIPTSTNQSFLQVSDNPDSNNWYTSFNTVSNNIFFRFTLPKIDNFVALIWCNQNNPTRDYSSLPPPNFQVISYYTGLPINPGRVYYCRYSNPGTYYIKLLAGQPALNNPDQNIQSIVKVNIGRILSSTSTSYDINTNFPVRARYVKYEITRGPTWIALREIEIYDDKGNKLTPIKADVSKDWQYHTAVGPIGAYDGKEWTVWNAGEYGTHWINFDLGSVKNISKIRILQAGSGRDEVHKLYISNDNSSYNIIDIFRGEGEDNTWIEFKFLTSS